MNNQPLVSICIPNYNNEKTISETLDSLVNQTYKNIIIKIFDNASTDNSMKILKEYEAKYTHIKVFQNETNIGGEGNFTKCFENAEGKYTAVFHSDDIYFPNIIEEEVKFLENNNCSAVATHSIFIDENGKQIGEHFIPTEIKDIDNLVFDFNHLFKISLKYGNIITCPSVMARTDVILEKIKYWDFENFKTSADFDVWLRLSKERGIGFINKPLIKYRMSNNSYSYTHNRLALDLFDMFLVFEYYLKDKNIQQNLDEKDVLNYIYQYNKCLLSININRYLINSQKEFLSYKKFKKINNFKELILFVSIELFNIIKYIPLTKKIKNIILEYKVRI